MWRPSCVTNHIFCITKRQLFANTGSCATISSLSHTRAHPYKASQIATLSQESWHCPLNYPNNEITVFPSCERWGRWGVRGGCRTLGGGDSSASRAAERRETVQDKDRCYRNALWAAVSNCSVLCNISCHDNGIFTEIDTQTGWSERKDHLKRPRWSLTVSTWDLVIAGLQLQFSPICTLRWSRGDTRSQIWTSLGIA